MVKMQILVLRLINLLHQQYIYIHKKKINVTNTFIVLN
jgi:hypothetical protein